LHGALVGVVINKLSTEGPLLLLTKAFEHVIRAHFHDGNLVIEALGGTLISGTLLVRANLLEATTRDETGAEGHKLGSAEDGRALTTVLVTEGLVLAVGVPIVMGLVMAMILTERVIQVTIKPVGLGHDTEEERHLRVVVRLVVVTGANRVDLLVKV